MMRGYDYGYGPIMGGGGWWWIPVAIFWLMVIAGVVLLVVWGVRQLNRAAAHGHDAQPPGGYPAQPTRDEACEIARVRYAKGEITREQYAELCHGLGVPGPPPLQPPVAYGQPPQAPAAPPAQPPQASPAPPTQAPPPPA